MPCVFVLGPRALIFCCTWSSLRICCLNSDGCTTKQTLAPGSLRFGLVWASQLKTSLGFRNWSAQELLCATFTFSRVLHRASTLQCPDIQHCQNQRHGFSKLSSTSPASKSMDSRQNALETLSSLDPKARSKSYELHSIGVKPPETRLFQTRSHKTSNSRE